jgi:hypothetical protein
VYVGWVLVESTWVYFGDGSETTSIGLAQAAKMAIDNKTSDNCQYGLQDMSPTFLLRKNPHH